MAVTELAVVLDTDTECYDLVCWLDAEHTRCERLAYIDDAEGRITWYEGVVPSAAEQEWVNAYAATWGLQVAAPAVM